MKHSLPNWAFKFMNFTNDVVLKNEMSLTETLEFISILDQRSHTYKHLYGKSHPIHFIFALPINDFSGYLLSFLTHSSMNFYPGCKFTLLQGRSYRLVLPDFSNKNLTIGDDIEIFTHQLRTSRMITDQLKSSSLYQTDDEKFMLVECERKSYKQIFNAEKSSLYAILIPMIMFWFVTIELFLAYQNSFVFIPEPLGSERTFWKIAFVILTFLLSFSIIKFSIFLLFFLLLTFYKRELKNSYSSRRTIAIPFCIGFLFIPFSPILIAYYFLVYFHVWTSLLAIRNRQFLTILLYISLFFALFILHDLFKPYYPYYWAVLLSPHSDTVFIWDTY